MRSSKYNLESTCPTDTQGKEILGTIKQKGKDHVRSTVAPRFGGHHEEEAGGNGGEAMTK